MDPKFTQPEELRTYNLHFESSKPKVEIPIWYVQFKAYISKFTPSVRISACFFQKIGVNRANERHTFPLWFVFLGMDQKEGHEILFYS